MAKCENCYHAEICKNYPNTGLPPKMRQELVNKGCEHYKDKSLIIELPCRVGDTVYILIDESEKFGGSYINEEKVVELYTAGRIWTDSCYYDSDDIGSILFFTREEAERALKEREKNGDEVR